MQNTDGSPLKQNFAKSLLLILFLKKTVIPKNSYSEEYTCNLRHLLRNKVRLWDVQGGKRDLLAREMLSFLQSE